MLIDTMRAFETLLTRIDGPNLRLTARHWSSPLPGAKRRSDAAIRRWASRLVNVHIEDMRAGVHEHLMFGEGEIDFPACPEGPGRCRLRWRCLRRAQPSQSRRSLGGATGVEVFAGHYGDVTIGGVFMPVAHGAVFWIERKATGRCGCAEIEKAHGVPSGVLLRDTRPHPLARRAPSDDDRFVASATPKLAVVWIVLALNHDADLCNLLPTSLRQPRRAGCRRARRNDGEFISAIPGRQL